MGTDHPLSDLAGRPRSSAAMLLAAALILGAALPYALPRMAAATETAADELRPDLKMLAPKDFSIDKRPRGGRWLRFDTVVVNAGHGPFDVVGTQEGSSVTQRILNTAGEWGTYSTGATMFWDGDGHRHWHVFDLQEWTLTHMSDAAVLRTGAKTGFCFWDNYPYPGTSSKTYLGSAECQETSVGTIPMGLSVGWGDEYPSSIAGQYINITGLALGDYLITVEADQRGEFLELDEDNNAACARIRISRSGVRVLAQDVDEPNAPASCLP